MKKKIFVGSIITVAILIAVSFTSVVGYRSVKSTPGKESPLFHVRTKSAIGEESNDLTYDYVGKGKRINLHLPEGNSRYKIVDEVIKLIKKMDDKSLSLVANLITYRFKYIDKLQQYNEKEIYQLLKLLRDNPEKLNRDNSAIAIGYAKSRPRTRTNGITCNQLVCFILILTYFLDIILFIPLSIFKIILNILKIVLNTMNCA